MNWSQYEWYMQSDAGYRVSKSYVDGRARYIAWTPDRSMLDGSPFFKSSKALNACESHHAAALSASE